MKSEIGSDFCITPDELAKENVACFSLDDLKCNGSDYALFSTGRSATSFVIKAIIERQPDLNKTVCLPPFTCQTVIEPFVKAGFEVVTYPLDSNFDAKVNDILQVLVSSNAKILLIHKYFGFNTIHNFNDLVYILKQKGIIIIEDCTQSLFSQFDRVDADYFVGSLRKWCGAPDGGFAVCKTGVFYNKPIDEDYTLIEAKKRAGVSKYRYLYHHQGEKQSFLSDYAQAEIILNAQKKLYTIGSLSKNIYSQLDVPLMIKRRQRNYKYLFDAIKDIKDIKPAFNNISSQICPLYFPVVCQDRTSIRNLLRNNDIYAPIIWPKAEALPEICNEVQYLYDNLLCIPIDQRYCIDDMERIASVLRGDEIRSAWMSWEDLYPFKEQLIDMEHELMIKYHYPDWLIPKAYPRARVENLKEHLASGNTFFLATYRGNELLGYVWCYISTFIDHKRWNIRSIMFKNSVKSKGYGVKALEDSEHKAKNLGCDEITTSFVPFNEHMERTMKKMAFKVSRIEVTKSLQ